MNNVINKIGFNKPVYKIGSIWQSPNTGNLHMLVRVDMDNTELYAAIDLASGNRWCAPKQIKENVVDGLLFVTEHANITISN